MKLKATKRYTYANRQLQEGDLFTAKNRQDHRVLLALRRAIEVSDPIALQVEVKQPAKADQSHDLETENKPVKRKGRKKAQEAMPSDDQ